MDALRGVRVEKRNVAGVSMFIAIHSTARGPALGGCRWKPYPSPELAQADAEALAQAMTRKAALARLALGGGKAVVIGDPAQRTREQLLAFGEFVESLGGEYITAADMGTGQEQMAVIAERTRHVTGLPKRLGGCGDPGPFTARGVQLALEAALASRGMRLSEVRVAIQGMGNVGRDLAVGVLAAGARVVAADPRSETHSLDGIDWVAPEEILEQRAEVFAPCGPPGVIDPSVAARLSCSIVCGGANNPLSELAVAAQLKQRDILYVPDFLANAGGLIHLAVALEGGSEADSLRHLEVIPENLERVLEHAKTARVDLGTAAIQLADSAVSG